MADAPYRRIHVVVNPASGKDEPVLNVLNDVFHRHGVDWDVSITHSTATPPSRRKAALADGVRPRRRLRRRRHPARDRERGPRGRRRLREPGTRSGSCPAAPATASRARWACPGRCARRRRSCAPSPRVRSIDVGRLRELGHATSRPLLHPAAVRGRRARGADEPRAQGPLRGLRVPRSTLAQRGPGERTSSIARELDGEATEFQASKVYVVNSGMMGTGLRITHGYSVDDGLLDCFFAIDASAHDTHRRGGVALPGPATRRCLADTTGRPGRCSIETSRTSPSGPTASTSGGRR